MADPEQKLSLATELGFRSYRGLIVGYYALREGVFGVLEKFDHWADARIELVQGKIEDLERKTQNEDGLANADSLE